MKWKFLSALFVVFTCAVASNVSASLIVNGSFEDGYQAPVNGFRTLYASNGTFDDINGWTVTGGSVDWIGDYWTPSEGSRSLDLSGNSQGTIASTSFTTVAGQSYRLTFDMAGNPDRGPDVKSLDVSVAGVTQGFTFDASTTNRSAMGWEEMSLVFVADAALTTLTFASTTAGDYYGPALDNVQVNAVPEPAAVAVWSVLCLVGIGLVRRRRRKAC